MPFTAVSNKHLATRFVAAKKPSKRSTVIYCGSNDVDISEHNVSVESYAPTHCGVDEDAHLKKTSGKIHMIVVDEKTSSNFLKGSFKTIKLHQPIVQMPYAFSDDSNMSFLNDYDLSQVENGVGFFIPRVNDIDYANMKKHPRKNKKV